MHLNSGSSGGESSCIIVSNWIGGCVKKWWSRSSFHVNSVHVSTIVKWNSATSKERRWLTMPWKWMWSSHWWSASVDVMRRCMDHLFIHVSDFMDSSLSVKLESEGFISLNEWVKLGGQSSILSSNNFNVVVQGCNLFLQVGVTVNLVGVSMLASIELSSHDIDFWFGSVDSDWSIMDLSWDLTVSVSIIHVLVLKVRVLIGIFFFKSPKVSKLGFEG